jgi:hypothetical protein
MKTGKHEKGHEYYSFVLSPFRVFVILVLGFRVLKKNFFARCVDLLSPDWGVWSL